MLSSASALPRDGREIRREAAVGDGFGVGDRDHAVYRDAGSQVRPFECFQQRFRQRESGGLDQDVVGRLRPRQQRRDGRHEVVGDGAAQAAIGEFDDGVLGAIGVGAAFQDIAVDAEVAEFVDQDRQPAALRILHQVTNQRGLSRAEEAGDDGDGYFFDRHVKFLNRLEGRRDTRDHTLAEDRRPLPPRHEAIRGGGVTRRAGEQIIDASLIEVAVDVAPASGAGEGDAAAAIAVGEALDLDDANALRMILTALRVSERVMQPAAGPGCGFVIFAGTAGDADVQRHRSVGGFSCCHF